MNRPLPIATLCACAILAFGCTRNDGLVEIQPVIEAVAADVNYSGYVKDATKQGPGILLGTNSYPELRKMGCNSFVMSPDERLVVYTQSNESSFHNIVVMNASTGDKAVILSYLESDPGSGRSVSYRWPSDSKVLFISGGCSSFSRNSSGTQIPVDLVYAVSEGKLYGME